MELCIYSFKNWEALFISNLFIHKACNHSFKWPQFKETQVFSLPYWSYLKAWSDSLPCLVYSLWSDLLWLLIIIISWLPIPLPSEICLCPGGFYLTLLKLLFARVNFLTIFTVILWYCQWKCTVVIIQLNRLFHHWTKNGHMTIKEREITNERSWISETKGFNRQAETKQGRTLLPQSITSIMCEWPDGNWFPTELFQALGFLQDNNP